MIQPGEPVRVRGERWRVRHVTIHEACAVIEVVGLQPSNAGATGRFLLPFETAERLPRSTDRPRIVRPSAWRACARAMLADATPSWTSLRAAARADVALLPYQLEPVLATTAGLACRLLLADEVGLGKTIQAGLIAAELLERNRDARILVVTPAGLRQQWRGELLARFAIEADVIDAPALARAAAHLPPGVNPWTISRVVITSIDFLKRPDVIRSLEGIVWDLVAFDEAHALAGRSDRAAAAQLVARRGRRVLALTATPHNGDEHAFERLCSLGRLGADDRLLIFRRSRVDAGVPAARVSRRMAVTPTREEALMHRALGAYAAHVNRHAPPLQAAAARLAMIVLTRRASSSAWSLERSIQRRMTLLDPSSADSEQLRLPLDGRFASEDDEPLEELAAPGLANHALEQRWLDRILCHARAVRSESKIAALGRLLRRTREPAIVFTEYRDTLQRVASLLTGEIAILHGGLDASERARETRRFTHGDARVLLATDAASEGLNLHHRCRLVVNLDVPWTPLRLEQRVGRVDRLGQRARVHAITLFARGTAEEGVAAALDVRTAASAESTAAKADQFRSADLRAQAEAEASWLTAVRTIARRARVDASGGCDRPPVALFPRKAPGVVTLGMQLLFTDAAGALIWSTLAGTAITCRCPGCAGRTSRAVRSWFEQMVNLHALPLAAASELIHQQVLTSLRANLRLEASALIARERAILGELTRTKGRLAAPLIQPGLFDRRAVREAEEQRRLADEAAGQAEERIQRLERLAQPLAGERHLLFAMVRSS